LDFKISQTRLPFSRMQTTRGCVVSYAHMTFTLTHDLDTRPWPIYSRNVLAYQK